MIWPTMSFRDDTGDEYTHNLMSVVRSSEAESAVKLPKTA